MTDGYSGGFATAYATDADGGDSVDLATTVRATRPAGPGEFAFVQLSHSAAGTCVVTVVTYTHALAASAATSGKLIGVLPQQTSTATLYREAAAGDFRGGILKFDLHGAPHYEIRVADPSTTTTVDIRTWTARGTPGA